MKHLIKPLLLLGAITFILTTLLHYFTHIPIWVAFIFAIVVQFLIHYIYESILLTYVGVNARKLEVDMLKELSYQSVNITCPCSLKNKQNIILRLNEDTQYECDQCKKTLNVNVDITSTLATLPLKTDAETFDKLLQEAKEKAPKV
jgi:hypothetical protein